MSDVCVIYLVWGPLETATFERFVSSYRTNGAGAAHRLVVAFKDVRGQLERSRLERIFSACPHESIETPGSCLDLGTYASLARRLDGERQLFLNSSSEPLANDWLAMMLEHACKPEIGVVSATGSYESSFSAARWPFRLWRRHGFPRFPNPHVRTTGFMMKRSLMLDLDWGPVTRKGQAYRLESGYKGITRQIRERGMRPLVIGRDGRGYEVDRWYESHTFRSGNQENLLIADKRTRDFDRADARTRRRLCEDAWGRRS